MRWVQLSQQLLEPELARSIESVIGVPADMLAAAWDLVRSRRGYGRFALTGEARRVVHVPGQVLREVQALLLRRVLYRGPVSPSASAGVPGRSMIDAARLHLSRPTGEVLAVDIQDAYRTTTYSRVVRSLRHRLRQELWILGLTGPERAKVLGVLGYLLTVPRGRGPGRQLPLGSPTSVALFNLLCLELDGAVVRLLGETFDQHGGANYTRYVDDLVISVGSAIPDTLPERIGRLVHRAGYELNPRKTRRTAVGAATVYGLRWAGGQLEPSGEVITRLAERVRAHLARHAAGDQPPAVRRRSFTVLRSIDAYLRQFYEGTGRPRPGPLQFPVPADEPTADDHPDLLWR
jgi:hypothetical protein